MQTFGDSKSFPITIGLHQESTLGSSMFAIVMDEIIRHIQEEVPWRIMFVDEICVG